MRRHGLGLFCSVSFHPLMQLDHHRGCLFIIYSFRCVRMGNKVRKGEQAFLGVKSLIHFLGLSPRLIWTIGVGVLILGSLHHTSHYHIIKPHCDSYFLLSLSSCVFALLDKKWYSYWSRRMHAFLDGMFASCSKCRYRQ